MVFQQLKKSIKYVLWLVLIAFIALIFLEWGMNYQYRDTSRVNAALVSDKYISRQEFNQWFQNNIEQMRKYSSKELSDTQIQDIKKTTLIQLINRSIIKQEVEKNRIRISDIEVLNYIKGNRAFYDEKGNFLAEKFKQYLQNSPIEKITSDKAYFSKVLEFDRIQDFVQSSYNVNEFELNEFIKTEMEMAEAGQILIKPENFVTEEQAKKYYNENLEKFYKEEEIAASHILIKVSKDASADKVKEAFNKITHIKNLLDNNASFEELAKKFSEDPGSKDKGGYLGYFKKGEMVKEFEDAAFALKKIGEISPIIKTDFGYHIIKLIDRKKREPKKFKEVEGEIKKIIVNDTHIKQARNKANIVLKKIKNGEVKFEEAAKKYSDGKTASEGGYLGKIPRTYMSAEHILWIDTWVDEILTTENTENPTIPSKITNNLFSLHNNEVSDTYIYTSIGFHIFKVYKRILPDFEKIDNDNIKRIRNIIKNYKQQDIYSLWLTNKRKKYKIKIFLEDLKDIKL